MSLDKEKKGIETTAEVEAALFRLGELERAKVLAKKAADRFIAEARETLRAAVAPLDDERRTLETALKGFGKAQRRAWEKAGRRSATYTHGELGWRNVTSIKLPKDEANFIVRLREAGMNDCVRVVEAPDVEALQHYDDASLENVGARRVTEDRFWAKPTALADTSIPAVVGAAAGAAGKAAAGEEVAP